MNLEKFTGPGSTPSRRRFWDSVADSVIASQKREGKNVSVQEVSGEGTIINVDRKGRSTATGACCIDGVCSILTESACGDAGGTYQGNGTPCDPDPCAAGCDSVEPVTLCKCGYPPFHIVDCTFPFTDHGYSDSFTEDDGCTFSGLPPCTTGGGTSVDPSAVYLSRSITQTARTPSGSGASCDTTCETTGFQTVTETTDTSDCSSSFEIVGLITCTDSDCGDCGCQDTHFLCSSCPGDPCVPVVSSHMDATGTVSDEYTTEMLIDNTLALLAPCPEGCVATYTLNEDETCCTAFCIAA